MPATTSFRRPPPMPGSRPAALVRVLMTLGFVGVGIALIALLTGRRPATPAV